MFKILAHLLACVFFSSCIWAESDNNPDYLPLDDSEYPYANLPRLIIETENFDQIRDTETDIPARLQVYGKETPQSEILELTIKGHGNSSFKSMATYNLKLKFKDKINFLGMPKDNEWILVSNFSDRTLIKNYTIYRLAQQLGASHTPRSLFCELYLNRQYMGIYQLTESIKVSKKRVNIPQNRRSFLFEKTTEYNMKGNVIQTKHGHLFRIRFPKNATSGEADTLKNFLDSFEKDLYSNKFDAKHHSLPLDINDYIRYYWLLELSKNHDGRFGRSIFFTWEIDDIIKMGPVWDYDESFGCTKDNMPKEKPEGWYAQNSGWNRPLFTDSLIWSEAVHFWKNNRVFFKATIDDIDKYANIIRKATSNEFRRWNSLDNTEFWGFKESYSNYDEALDSLKNWIKNRISWIDNNI